MSTTRSMTAMAHDFFVAGSHRNCAWGCRSRSILSGATANGKGGKGGEGGERPKGGRETCLALPKFRGCPADRQRASEWTA